MINIKINENGDAIMTQSNAITMNHDYVLNSLIKMYPLFDENRIYDFKNIYDCKALYSLFDTFDNKEYLMRADIDSKSKDICINYYYFDYDEVNDPQVDVYDIIIDNRIIKKNLYKIKRSLLKENDYINNCIKSLDELLILLDIPLKYKKDFEKKINDNKNKLYFNNKISTPFSASYYVMSNYERINLNIYKNNLCFFYTDDINTQYIIPYKISTIYEFGKNVD